MFNDWYHWKDYTGYKTNVNRRKHIKLYIHLIMFDYVIENNEKRQQKSCSSIKACKSR